MTNSHEFTDHVQVKMPTLYEQKLGGSEEKNRANYQQLLDLKNLTTSPKNQRKTNHHESYKSQVNVPFSWETKPGVSKLKVTDQDGIIERWHFRLELPSPPCPPKGSRANVYADDDQELAQVPLYLCPFQSPLKSYLKRGVIGKQLEDPFLVAYRKCRELYAASDNLSSDDYCKIDTRSKKINMKNMYMNISCKNSCAVTTDTLKIMSPHDRRRKGERIG